MITLNIVPESSVISFCDGAANKLWCVCVCVCGGGCLCGCVCVRACVCACPDKSNIAAVIISILPKVLKVAYKYLLRRTQNIPSDKYQRNISIYLFISTNLC